MTEPGGVLQFGRKRPEFRYRIRPAAHAVISDGDGKVAVVRGPGGLFLPGGGSRAGESPQETVRREVREECACAVVVAEPFGKAVQYFETASEAIEQHGVFFRARFAGEPSGTGEHELLWLAPEEAQRRLYHESHAWAVRCAPP